MCRCLCATMYSPMGIRLAVAQLGPMAVRFVGFCESFRSASIMAALSYISAMYTSISPNSFLRVLLFVYGRAADICVLLFHASTLLKVLMSSRSFLVESLSLFRQCIRGLSDDQESGCLYLAS